MSETVLAFLITVLILGALAAWVPLLHLCGRGASRLNHPHVQGTLDDAEQPTQEQLVDVA